MSATDLAERRGVAGARLDLEHWPIERLVPSPRNARTHSAAQIAEIAGSIRTFGFCNPVLVGDDGDVIAGHGRLAAARLLGLADVPVIPLRGLSEVQRRQLMLADNRIALNAGWDAEMLNLELKELSVMGADLSALGFTAQELADALNPGGVGLTDENEIPPVAYVWHGALHATTVAESLTRQGFTIRAQIIWAKERLVIGRGDYHWQHEPCWYAVRTKGNWTGDRKQTTLWTIPSGGQDTETIHGTQKPVECMRRPMLNNSSPGHAVYEPFLGSGTTLIAAQTSGRSCFAIELDPLYVDVAIRRWQAFTGEPATLLADGRAFDAVTAERSDPVKKSLAP